MGFALLAIRLAAPVPIDAGTTIDGFMSWAIPGWRHGAGGLPSNA
jgi:hypothetical protein